MHVALSLHVRAGCVLVLLGNTVLIQAGKETASSLDDVITARDQERLTELFSSAEPYDEIEMAYYIVSGLEAIGFNDDNKQLVNNACAFANARDWTELRDIFYASSVSAMLKDSCKVTSSVSPYFPHCLYIRVYSSREMDFSKHSMTYI